MEGESLSLSLFFVIECKDVHGLDKFGLKVKSLVEPKWSGLRELELLFSIDVQVDHEVFSSHFL